MRKVKNIIEKKAESGEGEREYFGNKKNITSLSASSGFGWHMMDKFRSGEERERERGRG